MTVSSLPRPFVVRRFHSLMGLWLVVYLVEHLLVNAGAVLYVWDGGARFVEMVNRLEALPYLRVIEVVFLGVPFFVHMVWGVLYLRSAKYNAHKGDGSEPALPQYPRNRAFGWHRVTAWVLVPLIIGHVVQMRFVEYLQKEGGNNYVVHLTYDKGLIAVAEGLGAKVERGGKEVIVHTAQAGVSFFLVVRETFKSPLMVLLYSLFVVAAVYHAFNGLWTFCITWGITLRGRAQGVWRRMVHAMMAIMMLVGLAIPWGVYWTVQFQG